MGWSGQCQERLLALAAFFAKPPGFRSEWRDINGWVTDGYDGVGARGFFWGFCFFFKQFKPHPFAGFLVETEKILGCWNRHEGRLFFLRHQHYLREPMRIWWCTLGSWNKLVIPRESPFRDSCGSWSVATFPNISMEKCHLLFHLLSLYSPWEGCFPPWKIQY